MSLPRKQMNKQTNQAAKLEQSDFEMIFNQNWERINQILYRLVGDWQESEDLALITFMQFYQHPPRKNENINGWLYRVATNLGLNAIRAGKRRTQYEQEAGKLIIENHQPDDPETALERLQEQERVRMTLASMKPRSAKLLVLRHSGLSYAEIAAVLNLAVNSVGTLLVRAENEFEKKYTR